MDFAYTMCVLLSALMLHGSFGQDAETVEGQSSSFGIKISPESQNQMVGLGTKRVLTCVSSTTDSNQTPVLHWEINDVKITTTSTSDRIRVESNSDGHLMLRIDQIEHGDEGTYRCVGTLGLQTDSRTVRLEVYEAIKINSPRSQIGIVDKIGVIICNATGKPAPSISFKFANKTKIENSDRINVLANQLVIKNVTFDDNGTYLCDVDVYQTGESEPFSIDFEVAKLPLIEESLVIDPITPKVGDTITVSCRAVGVPEPTYKFKKGDNFISEDQVNVKNGILTLRNIQKEDEGDYVCVATNKGGFNEKSIFLKVQIPPMIKPMQDVIEVMVGEPKQVNCVAEGDPAPTLTWKRNGQDVSEDEDSDDGTEPSDDLERDQEEVSNTTTTKTLNFASIRADHAGTYECTAMNGAGTSSKTVTLDIKFKPNFNTDYRETNFYGWEGHTSNLTCQASASEVASIQFYKTSGEAEAADVPIETQDQYTLSSTQEWAEYHLSSRSLLVSVGSEDSSVYGDYYCEAENTFGTARHTIRLIQAITPKEPVVTLSSALSTMVTLQVKGPAQDGGQPVQGYYYSYFQSSNNGSDAEESYVEMSGETIEVDLRNLVAKTSYVVKVTAKNAVGRGEELSLEFDTKEVSKPLQLNITSPREGSEPTSFQVVWSEPDNGGVPITHFIIKYKKVTIVDKEEPQWKVESDVDKAFEVKTLNDPSARSYTIQNLDRGSFYVLRISAVNREGESTEETKIVQTSEGAGVQASQAADGGEEEEEVKEKTDDNDEKNLNAGVNGEKRKEGDGKTGAPLGSKSGSESAAGVGSGTVIGIIVGLLILILIIAVVLFLVFKKKPELVGRLRGLGGKGGEEERGKNEDGKDPAEEEKLIKKDDTVKVENETDEGKPEEGIQEHQQEFEPDNKPEAQPTPDAGAKNGTGDKAPELSTPAPTTEIKITPETPEKPENPTA